ncbi:CDP-diacylglycerol--glycerol-3-phosphate 3-phosphatidyltransferase [Sulfitobacter mediterraneus]|jgi:CDP-diacylglycerol---glycerol-3-phosphate 3-phosphatidyltransferase|uniref:CDP-diacylglycerol--glycerol-3-phosphate 3-phosphatidyltransferase n=1 Tax=Sulfitobacter mediterraneus TaxID=83219 RepID=A0A061SN35_9RHOB|nr:CDP-diacylglycerol--glycerol-3-phosphate 3-phosphatidyltransferase [Sulfitobacter mediterraneus]KAJ02252.1 CDP-diacylglycerol--glycerol-3-phosphate 3-phosphatidyltransferase [Sulfitobacter mediterraneus]KIN77774.1 CDP-diacylglycerol-glycerol-3-phosphate 3-phosphatidyltransferase [Sulfitobacter mediterraneus KCTC 32188]MBM1310623.1 CDP-diacylglycerol--glycerol-3-phosphate 3-phosphatidyltransferase [Sulfitobacter mediterraneus]MBM1314507.1 CDP-diacylglycerol--glycerol-3-phosphate 3-phosphatidy
MKWNLPNILTVLRLVAAPGVAVMFLYFTRPYADWFALILFLSAAITDWFDGYLARAWKQETKLGAMLDPIADKAMVVIALMVIIAFSSWSPWLILPSTVILFREVFVSGLREFLGDVAGTLKVTQLAKWKTTFQMTAITVLFAQGVFEHYLGMSVFGMDEAMIDAVLNGEEEDVLGLRWKLEGMEWAGWLGLWLLWIAAALTAVTGFDYLRKALPHLREGQ